MADQYPVPLGKRSNPLQIRHERQSIILDLQNRVEHNQMAPVSPPEQRMIKAKVPTFKNYGIVTGIKENNSPV